MARPAVGILGYQGCIEPHEKIFATLGAPCLRVRTPEDLRRVDRLILPGGESTTMLRFIRLHEMWEPLKSFAANHRVWGICAGSILIAAEVKHPAQESLNLIDIVAHRNFYGSQNESFTAQLEINLCPTPVEAHFIRAPLLVPRSSLTHGRPPLVIQAHHKEQPVFFSQGQVWACSFHVELGSDLRLHEKFLS